MGGSELSGSKTVARMVAWAFLDHEPGDGYVVTHIGERDDDSVGNLRLVSRRDVIGSGAKKQEHCNRGHELKPWNMGANRVCRTCSQARRICKATKRNVDDVARELYMQHLRNGKNLGKK